MENSPERSVTIFFASASSASFGTESFGRMAKACGRVTSSACRSVVRTSAPSYTCTMAGYSFVRIVIDPAAARPSSCRAVTSRLYASSLRSGTRM